MQKWKGCTESIRKKIVLSISVQTLNTKIRFNNGKPTTKLKWTIENEQIWSTFACSLHLQLWDFIFLVLRSVEWNNTPNLGEKMKEIYQKGSNNTHEKSSSRRKCIESLDKLGIFCGHLLCEHFDGFRSFYFFTLISLSFALIVYTKSKPTRHTTGGKEEKRIKNSCLFVSHHTQSQSQSRD